MTQNATVRVGDIFLNFNLTFKVKLMTPETRAQPLFAGHEEFAGVKSQEDNTGCPAPAN